MISISYSQSFFLLDFRQLCLEILKLNFNLQSNLLNILKSSTVLKNL